MIPVNTLMEEAKCYLCLGISQTDALVLALLNRISSGGGGGGSLPSGMIALWSGTVATIPSGWALCDGSAGTPDLRDRFVVGARQDNAGVAMTNLTGALTQSGGSISHTHTVNDPGHIHSYVELAVNGAPATVSAVDFDTGGTTASVTDVTVNSQSAPQPYYALAYIMKT